MENPTLISNRISWLILSLIVIIFLLYLGGVAALFRKSKKLLDNETYKRIKKPLLWMGCSGFGIISLISSCWGTTFVPLLVYSYQDEIVSCQVMPIADDYKFVIAGRRNGERDVHFEEYDGSQRYIWSITKFVILDEYIMGESSLFEFDRDYFWFNLKSKELYDTRPQIDIQENVKEGVFLESLDDLGIPEIPEMTSIETLCTNDECSPCSDYSIYQ